MSELKQVIAELAKAGFNGTDPSDSVLALIDTLYKFEEEIVKLEKRIEALETKIEEKGKN